MLKDRKAICQQGIHCVGNGKAAGYYRNADILQLFGPCYSVNNAASLKMAEDGITTSSWRYSGTGIWKTEVYQDSEPAGTMLDYAHPTLPMLVRRMLFVQPMRFKVESEWLDNFNHDYPSSADAFPEEGSNVRMMMMCIPVGSTSFAMNKTDDTIFCALLIDKNIPYENGVLTFPAGESVIRFVAGEKGAFEVGSFYNCMQLAKECLDTDLYDMLDAEEQRWDDYFASMRDFSDLLEGAPRRAELEELIDSTAVALKSQTSVQGGVLAGHYYHLGYGRDMYGVTRGYLALGLYEEARNCIQFFIDTWHSGLGFPNAAGMGMKCAHRHEIDEVEQTGYHLLALSDYFGCTGDVEFLRKNADYFCALMEIQESKIAGGMLPFNGDETYIAGGLIPRTVVDNGSMESTALYIMGTERICALAQQYGLVSDDVIAAHREKAAACRAAYESNFVRDGKVITNNPAWGELGQIPEYRHGVCVNCGRMYYMKRTKDNGFLCLHCYGKAEAAYNTEIFSLSCALLMTGYVGSDLPGEERVKAAVRELMLAGKQRNGDDRSVGYEHGLWLYMLADEDCAAELADEVMRRRTSAGVWCEYYLPDGRADEGSCQYRPWESAINLTGIVRWLERRK